MGFAAAGGEKVFKLTRERCLSGGGTGGTRRANSRLTGYGKWDGWYQQAGHWDIGTPWSPGPLRLLRRDGEQSTVRWYAHQVVRIWQRWLSRRDRLSAYPWTRLSVPP